VLALWPHSDGAPEREMTENLMLYRRLVYVEVGWRQAPLRRRLLQKAIDAEP
jgi:hypothetical protein